MRAAALPPSPRFPRLLCFLPQAAAPPASAAAAGFAAAGLAAHLLNGRTRLINFLQSFIDDLHH